MAIKFKPHYTITPEIVKNLLRIEAAKEKIAHLPLTPTVLTSLRESARLNSTHYSTAIEGNILTADQVKKVLKHDGHFPGRKRDEHEIKGYYKALAQIEQWAAASTPLSEKMIQTIHALVIGGGKKNVTPTPYRDGQNVICDSATKEIVYLPPEACDVQKLMHALVQWLKNTDVPCPIGAGIAHYQYATIHPYFDGNGRTARLLTTFILHAGGYDIKGLYSLEEYYARNLNAYYEAINIGPSHNYYMGRSDADITSWIDYFIKGMAVACENILKRMNTAELNRSLDQSSLIRKLDPRQRKVLSLFEEFETITSSQLGTLFGFQPSTCTKICSDWVNNGFLEIIDFSRKGRKYKLSKNYEALLIKK